MALSRWLQGILNHYAIPYEEHHHPPVYSASRLARAEHVSGHRVAKTVLVTAHGRPLALVLPACARLDLGQVQAVMGDKDLRLATEAEIASWFKGCQPGTVPPLPLRTDMCLLMDRSLAHLGRILFPAGTPEDAVVVRFRDWYRAVRPGVGRFALTTNGRASAGTAAPILIVEDEHDTNELLCRLVERDGHACRGAEQGSQALAMASELHPSAILLDLMLPDMSGFDMYERLRRTGPIKRVPVIVVTALDDEQSRERSRQLGADAYLTKPFLPKTLMAELNDLLADARA
jgi:CheY-like chemotaxis protein/prolyl-tRNA editing enzyme YbaK/EbsC (Cys-tRNA(Pro) deacylase)